MKRPGRSLGFFFAHGKGVRMLSQSFSLSSSRCAPISDPTLRDEIQSRTGNVDATARILRSIDRFGADPSIQRYEIEPLPPYRQTRVHGSVAWAVRAVR